MDDNLKQRIEALLSMNNSDGFKVIEFGIDFKVVQKYWALIKQHPEQIPLDELLVQAQQFDHLPFQEQTILLTHLGRSGSIEGYRTIEAFMEEQENQETPNEAIGKWTVVALQHCRIHLENELLDEPIGFIATGLGGRGNKIRFYVVLVSNEPLQEVMVSEIDASIREEAPAFNVEIEAAETINSCIYIKLLAPFNTDLQDLVSAGIQNYPFIHDDFIITNMSKPSIDTVEKWMQEQTNKRNNSDDDEIDLTEGFDFDFLDN